MKRYFYIVWRRVIYSDHLNYNVIDKDPADWLIEALEQGDKLAAQMKEGFPSSIVIINQFEITAEQYNRLESLQ